jgi:threonine dehydrogenase-like Zn-dependent dehydrogenase
MFGTSAYAEAALADPGAGAISLVVTGVQGDSAVGTVVITGESNLALLVCKVLRLLMQTLFW